MAKLSQKFNEEIQPTLKKELNIKNNFEIPKVEKVVVSVGIGAYKEDKNAIDKIISEFQKVVGQKPKINRSKKAVSAFKLRIGQVVGLTATLRGERMFDFINRFVNVALPRVRDFRGLNSESFDGQGNYTVGLKDYSIFPEIRYEDVTHPFGLEVNVKIKARSREEARLLLEKIGFPFSKKDKE